MDVVASRCAGIEIGKSEVVVCLRIPGSDGERLSEVRTFSAFAGDVEKLADWLAANAVSHVVMEATGQYWRPVWDVLAERGFELMLVNARHVKMVPGRKTDVADAAWLAELMEHGLLRGSFVPPRAIRELRDLTRYRKRLVQTHTSEGQRIAKILEDAGIKLDSVASDLLVRPASDRRGGRRVGRDRCGWLLIGERSEPALGRSRRRREAGRWSGPA